MFKIKGEKNYLEPHPGSSLASGLNSTIGLPLPSVIRERREPEMGKNKGKPFLSFLQKGVFSHAQVGLCLLEKWVLGADWGRSYFLMTAQRVRWSALFHVGTEAFMLARCFPGCDSKAKNILWSLGQKLPCPQPGRTSFVHMKGQGRPPWG